MNKTISATDARIHFGEIMRSAQKRPVVVERAGVPIVVIVSKSEYDRLVSGKENDWRSLVNAARQRVNDEMKGRELPLPEDIIQKAREERSGQAIDGMR